MQSHSPVGAVSKDVAGLTAVEAEWTVVGSPPGVAFS